MSAALSFVTFGLGKAFHMQEMAEFFAQHGYSTSFLNFIVAAEVLGGAALLIPRTVLPAIIGFSIDMFGAIYAHIHNGDAINDNMNAVTMVVGLGTLAFVWALGHGTNIPDNVARKRVIGVAVVAVICVFVAAAGSAILRHSKPLRAAQQTRATVRRPFSLDRRLGRCFRST